MLFRGKPLGEVIEADIQQLLSEQVEEGKLLDYKRDLPGKKDDDKKEFLHDVASFANTGGGHLLFGVEEKDRVPVAIPGVPASDAETAILRLEALVRDSIEPRIAGVVTQSLKLKGGQVVLLMQIPRSWAAPHMVKSSSKFYARNSAGKYALDVSEIRSAFVASESLAQRIQGFRSERLAKIIGGEVTLRPTGSAQVVLHVCPLVSFTPGFQIDLTRVATTEELKLQPFPVGAPLDAFSSRFVFEGRLLHWSSGADADAAPATSLLFRSGCIESVNSQLLQPVQRGAILEKGIVESSVNDALKSYLPLLALLGAEPPWVVMLSLVNVSGYLLESRSMPFLKSKPMDRDHLLLPDVMIQDAETTVERAMRPAYDVLWNACGMAYCFLYDKNGEWKEDR